jgi:hypothetical protein
MDTHEASPRQHPSLTDGPPPTRPHTDTRTTRRINIPHWLGILFLASLALSVLTTIARFKLWFGPQTFVLGSVGMIFSIAVAWLAWRWSRAPEAPRLDRFTLTTPAMIALALGCGVLCALILRVAFRGFANSADEYGFLFSGHTLAELRLWLPSPSYPDLFRQQYLLAAHGRWVSQYLPGWPAIIAVFLLLHLPAWIAAPTCAAALLLVLGRALRLECASPALATALLLAFAASSFFLLNGATYFSHCLSALTVVGAILCMLQAERRSHWIWPAAAGACVGYALLCRIDSFALAGLAAFAAWIEQGCRRRTLLLGVAGMLPLVALYGGYDWAITGVPFEPPTIWAGFLRFGPHGMAGTEAAAGPFRMIVQTLWRLGELADTASLVLPALYLAALYRRWRTRHMRFYDVVPIANFVVFLIYPELGGFQMGPRYWFDGFVVMHMTVASAFGDMDVAWRRFATACCALLIPVSLARLPAQVAFHARVADERSAMFRRGAALPQGTEAVILVNDFPSAWDDRANRTDWNLAKDFARNGTSLDRRVLYARGDEPDALRRVCSDFPQREILSFHLDRAHPGGWLTRDACR